eukprot:378099-Pyramimonas_sp.AAC.1
MTVLRLRPCPVFGPPHHLGVREAACLAVATRSWAGWALRAARATRWRACGASNAAAATRAVRSGAVSYTHLTLPTILLV